MMTNFISDLAGSAVQSVAALPLKDAAFAYLAVSLLGPLCWILAIEICRYARAAKNAPVLGTAPAAALLIATRRHPATPGLMDRPLSEN